MPGAANAQSAPPTARLVATALLAAGLAAVLAVFPMWRALDLRAFDLVSTVWPPQPSAAQIVVVAIDEPSMAQIARQWPWPRSLHARLIRRLRSAGAKVIALDIVFAEPSNPESDDDLARALGPDVVLAADFTRVDSPEGIQDVRVEPADTFLRGGARSGLTALILDPDGTLRRVPPYADGFAERVVAMQGVRAPVPEPALLQFFGPPRTYPTVSYYQALDPDLYLPPGFLRGRTALVGLGLQNTPVLGGSAGDAFATPYTWRTGQLTAGVEAQATIADNLRAGLFIRPVPVWARMLAVLLAAACVTALLRAPVSPKSIGAALLAAACMVIASWLALRFGRTWISPLGPATAGLAALGLRSADDLARERRQRRAIVRAFAHYLAPELVARLADDPAAVRLGGERRVLTILFCDVRGFTALAEAMKQEPERLTSLVNRLLGPLSETILRHGGTVDKFMGDCVMAFWNAPLDDPLHARHAVTCGLAMLAALEETNQALAAESAANPRFAIGIGINTGECVVGNMGSEHRFDYSAVGDAVNLAARLEALSKRYDVPLLIGAETKAALGEDRLAVELDRIAVRGRSEATPVFTVLADDQVQPDDRASYRVAHERFLAAWRARDAEEAAALATRCAALAPVMAGYYDMARTRLADQAEDGLSAVV